MEKRKEITIENNNYRDHILEGRTIYGGQIHLSLGMKRFKIEDYCRSRCERSFGSIKESRKDTGSRPHNLLDTGAVVSSQLPGSWFVSS